VFSKDRILKYSCLPCHVTPMLPPLKSLHSGSALLACTTTLIHANKSTGLFVFRTVFPIIIIIVIIIYL